MKRKPNRFHGRIEHGDDRRCEAEGCAEAGEFRAPKSASPEVDGYHWFCLDHVRDYNARWNVFDHTTPDQAARMANGHLQWDRPTWPFGMNPNGSATLHDPMGVLKGVKGFEAYADAPHPITGKPMSAKDKRALSTLGLDERATSADIRLNYRALLKRYHPDHNGGDKEKEKKLRAVIDAYKHLTKDGKMNRQNQAHAG